MSSHAGRLSPFLKTSWGVGAIGTTSMLYLVNMFLVFFLVRHVGMPAAVAGSLLAVTRFYDAVIDPAIGTLSDRTHSRWGRRRPWMLAGAVFCPISCIAIFNPPVGLADGALYSWMLVALLAYLTAYSLFSIPYMALGTEMSDDYAERASVMAYRTFFVYCSGLLVASGAPALVALLGKDRAAYSWMSVAVGVLVGATMLWVVFFTGEARVTVRSKERVPFGLWWRSVLSNGYFLLILITKMALQLGTAFQGASMLFFMSYVLQKGEGALALYGLISNLVGIATVPLWSRVLRSVERRPVFIALLVANGIGYLSWMTATPQEPDAVLALRAIWLGAAGSGSVLVALAMLTDTIEYDRLRTGQRREGLFVGGFELVQTTSFVVGPLVVGFAFQTAGLKPGDVSLGDQPESALQMIRFAVAVIPSLCCLAGILLLLLYRLDAGRLATLRAAHATGPGEASSPSPAAAPLPTAAR
jgi:glycoside/pentoside/hexuronide:cation symporter, GPH family